MTELPAAGDNYVFTSHHTVGSPHGRVDQFHSTFISGRATPLHVGRIQ